MNYPPQGNSKQAVGPPANTPLPVAVYRVRRPRPPEPAPVLASWSREFRRPRQTWPFTAYGRGWFVTARSARWRLGLRACAPRISRGGSGPFPCRVLQLHGLAARPRHHRDWGEFPFGP